MLEVSTDAGLGLGDALAVRVGLGVSVGSTGGSTDVQAPRATIAASATVASALRRHPVRPMLDSCSGASAVHER
ncbi:hypothetical protein [uncultured Demequina sp.]|uniref:hypothetical protein n=1 Tax=uncultured Demequina sp. TaxID=693499 RepID=UPI0025E76F7D|nr:hypothetical protein [uncultured Demequina sp.]